MGVSSTLRAKEFRGDTAKLPVFLDALAAEWRGERIQGNGKRHYPEKSYSLRGRFQHGFHGTTV